MLPCTSQHVIGTHYARLLPVSDFTREAVEIRGQTTVSTYVQSPICVTERDGSSWILALGLGLGARRSKSIAAAGTCVCLGGTGRGMDLVALAGATGSGWVGKAG